MVKAEASRKNVSEKFRLTHQTQLPVWDLSGLIVPNTADVINDLVSPFRKRDGFEGVVIDQRDEQIAF
jgi:hypothetical protein